MVKCGMLVLTERENTDVTVDWMVHPIIGVYDR
jgi:hypothetical protein